MQFRNIWTQLKHLAPERKILSGTREIKGTVVQQGVNIRTVTVRAYWKIWNFRYRCYYKRAKNYQVHDQDEVTRLTDTVVIKSSPGLSKTKNYYVKYIVEAGPRFDYWDKLRPEEALSLKGRLYESVPGTNTEVEGFRVRALRERLINIRQSGIYEGVDSKG